VNNAKREWGPQAQPLLTPRSQHARGRLAAGDCNRRVINNTYINNDFMMILHDDIKIFIKKQTQRNGATTNDKPFPNRSPPVEKDLEPGAVTTTSG
jgi:hypothetical protein